MWCCAECCAKCSASHRVGVVQLYGHDSVVVMMALCTVLLHKDIQANNGMDVLSSREPEDTNRHTETLCLCDSPVPTCARTPTFTAVPATQHQQVTMKPLPKQQTTVKRWDARHCHNSRYSLRTQCMAQQQKEPPQPCHPFGPALK